MEQTFCFGFEDANGKILEKKINNVIKTHKCNNQCDYASSHACNLRRHLKTHIGEQSNKCNQCDYASSHTDHLRTHLKTNTNVTLHPLRKKTFKNATWRKVKQLQSMWICILLGRQFEETFENAQWRKVQQMQPMWFCILSGRQFEDTFVALLNNRRPPEPGAGGNSDFVW